MKKALMGFAMAAAVAGCGGGSTGGGSATSEAPPATQGGTAGGGGAQAPQTPQEGMAQMARGMEQVAQGFQQMTQGSAKPVDFEQLMTVLNEVDGWTRSEPRGEQMNMPVSFSSAEARYGQGEAQVYVKIQDSALNQMLIAPFTMFLRTGFEERSSDGYKRYAEFAGNPGLEEWTNRNNNGEVTVIVAKRFIVTARGTRVANLDAVKDVLSKLGLGKLPGLATAAK